MIIVIANNDMCVWCMYVFGEEELLQVTSNAVDKRDKAPWVS